MNFNREKRGAFQQISGYGSGPNRERFGGNNSYRGMNGRPNFRGGMNGGYTRGGHSGNNYGRGGSQRRTQNQDGIIGGANQVNNEVENRNLDGPEISPQLE